MQIILASLLTVLPCQPFELAVPVVRGQLALTLESRVAPNVVVAVRVILALAALPEPHVLVGCVVDDQIHEDGKTKLVSSVQDFFELVECAVVRMDVPVVRDVIAIIRVRRRVDRGEPDPVHTKRSYVIQLVVHAVQVADSIAVAVAEAPYPYLI